jgi:hypothetical protein
MTPDSKQEKLAALRKMIEEPSETPPETPEVDRPMVFRDEWGNRCSEKQWDVWQEKKRKATEKGFQIDEYSQ